MCVETKKCVVCGVSSGHGQVNYKVRCLHANRNNQEDLLRNVLGTMGVHERPQQLNVQNKHDDLNDGRTGLVAAGQGKIVTFLLGFGVIFHRMSRPQHDGLKRVQ